MAPAPGGPLTFEAVFQENSPFVWRVLRRLGVGDADLEDVCQDVFVVLHRRLGDFDGRTTLRAWIYGICVRVASEHRRRPHRRHEELAEPPDVVVPAPQLEALARRRTVEALDRALGTLDDDKRAVFVLYEIEQLSIKEICDILGCPAQTAYSRLHAARKHLELEMHAHRERSEG
jgi:RNA polymerase sigma-70 factor (ECF subfamily)